MSEANGPKADRYHPTHIFLQNFTYTIVLIICGNFHIWQLAFGIY